MEKLTAENVECLDDSLLDHRIFASNKQSEEFELLDNMESLGALDIKNIAEDATNALSQLIQSKKPPRILAGVHSKIVALAYKAVKDTNSKPEKAISTILQNITKEIQTNMKKGSYAFSNEDIFAQFGITRERGVYADIQYLLNQEDAPAGSIRKHYSNALLDNSYGIDYITTTFSHDENEHHSLMVDLVQVKSDSNRLEKVDKDRIVLKHMDFLKRYNFVFEDFKAKEASEVEIEKLIDSLGTERALYMRQVWDMAHSEEDEEQSLSWFLESLDEYKNNVINDAAFHYAPNSAKYSYILGIGERAEIHNDSNARGVLSDAFSKWQKDWLSEIAVKKQKVYKPIGGIKYRLVVFSADGEKDIYYMKNDN